MEIRHLQTFAVAAETQSFTRTAELVGLTQSAVSQHVGLLEKELGRSLFDRGANSITLTEFGKVLHHHARRILDIVEEIKQEAGHKVTEVAGLVTIAVSSVPSEWLLPELLLIIRAAHPNIQESVKVSGSEQAIEAVESGEVDFALVGELPRATNLYAKRVAEDELVLVVAPDHALANKKSIQPKQLLEHAFIFREPGSGSRRCVENALSLAGLPTSDLIIPIEVNANDAIRAAVERGVGISFLSKRAIQRELDDQRLVRVDIEGIKIIRSLYLVTDPGRLPNPIVRTVLDLVDEFRKESFGRR
jgi:DNA-binding transcriptional LysR family regulator